MLMIFWMMACGPSQDQLDCLSECGAKHKKYSSQEECVRDQEQLQQYRLDTLSELNARLEKDKSKFTTNLRQYDEYSKQCDVFLNSSPEEMEAALQRSLKYCKGTQKEKDSARQKKFIDAYKVDLDKKMTFERKLKEAEEQGGSLATCTEKVSFSCEEECDNK